MRYRWESFELDVPARRLTGPEGAVHVEPQVFDVLAYLVENLDRVVGKEELLDQVWGDQFVSESALTTRIKEARRAIGDDGRAQRFVRNVHGRGYQFVGELFEKQTQGSEGAGDGAGEEPSRPVLAATVVPLAMSIAVDAEYPFVGRSAEIDQIDVLITKESGSAQILIGGAPGFGKSRLAVEVLERARAGGAVVCAGRCDQQLSSSLQPIRDAVGQLAAGHPTDFVRWAEGIERPLCSLIPSIGSLFDAEPVEVDGYAGLDALLTIFDRASTQISMLLLVDDLQWSDQPTRAFLSRVHRRPVDQSISTIATFRSGTPDLPSDVKQWISEQTRLSNTKRLDLLQLDVESSTELVRSVLSANGDGAAPSDTAVNDVLGRTSGHPLFLTESLRDLQLGNTSSQSVADLVAARLERLDDDVRNLVQAGALIGPEFTFALATEAAGLGPEMALDAIDRAVAAELLHETASPSRFRFSHQLIPQAVQSTMSRATRAQIHYRCAGALESAQAAPAEIAWHLLGSIPLVQAEIAVAKGVTAGQAAMEAKEFDRAIRLFERCLEVETQTRQRAELLVATGGAKVAAGRSASGAPHFAEAAYLARTNGWVDLLVASALGHYGRSPFRKPADRSTLELLHEALEALGDKPSTLRARVMSKIAAFSAFEGSLSQRDQMTRDALEMASEASLFDRMELLESRAIVFTCPAGAEELPAINRELEALREEADVYFADAAAPETALLMHGDGAGLRDVARFDETRVRAQPIAEWRDLVLRSTLAGFAGDFEEALALCDEAGRIGQPYWGDSAAVLHGFGQLFVSSLTDDWSLCHETLALLHSVSDSILFQTTYAWAQAAGGDLSGARKTIEKARPSSFRWLGEHIVGGNALIAAVEVGLLLEDAELLDLAETSLRPYSHLMMGVPWACSFAAADSLARLARQKGAEADAVAFEAEAQRLYQGLDAPALLARLS